MDANAELNQMLLNAMFALNEAGDNLDAIYRIGLETAVSLLNADRGCIFERNKWDEWEDNKWTIAKTHQFDQKQAKLITTTHLLSQAVENEYFPIASKLIELYQGNDMFIPEAIYSFPLKMFRWPKWFMQIEANNQVLLNERKLQVVNQFCNQVERFLQKACQYEKTKQFLMAIIHQIRAPTSIAIGTMDLMLVGAMGSITDQQKELIELAKNAATRILETYQSATPFPLLFNQQQPLAAQVFYKRIKEFSPQLGNRLPTDEFIILINEAFFFHLIEAILKKSTQSQIEISKKLANPKLTINCFYEDLNLTTDNSSPIWRSYDAILQAGDAPLFLMKKFVNYNGGQFKISAEAGKGYTVTITFPIVTEDAHE